MSASTISPIPRQLALALEHTESYAREDFLSGPGNEGALTLIENTAFRYRAVSERAI